MNKYDYLTVGAGFTRIVLAERLFNIRIEQNKKRFGIKELKIWVIK